ncbi:MAG: ABC transporter ATP-binding protein [Bacillota bacterium]
MIIRVNGLSFSYNSRPVLKDVSLELAGGEILGVIGPNGSGKSTLLKCMDRILKPKGGSILIDGKAINSFTMSELARLIGFVPQREENRFPVEVFDAILMGRKPFLNWKPSPKDMEKVSEIIEVLKLQDIALRDIGSISGGERQKVIIARAIAQEPEMLLLDEPTSYLDLRHQLEVMDIIKDLAAKGTSSVVAVHDLNLAARYCDKLVLLREGEIFAAGGREVLQPENIEPVYQVKIWSYDKEGRRFILADRPI